MLDVVAKVFRSHSSATIEKIARLVVEESVQDIAQLVANNMEGMSLSEARGYVRARSAQIVRKQTRLALRRYSQAKPNWSATIAQSATERLVPLVLRQARVGIPRLTECRAAA